MTVTVEFDELRNLPRTMRERPQWLLWRFETYEGDKKPRKVPYYLVGAKRKGTQGDDADRSRLSTFDQVFERLRGDNRYSGIGFAFLPGDGLIGIDIDGAIDLDTGEMQPHLVDIIQRCSSYTERSPSGRGVHIIVAGETKSFKDNKAGIEVFCGVQFFTCTGDRWEGTPDDVQPVSAETLEHLHRLVRGARAATGKQVLQVAPDPSTELRKRLEDALHYLVPDAAYDDWLKVGMGLKAALGEAGFRLWDYWSSTGSKYPGADDLRNKWASFDGSGVTEGTLFHMAKQGGYAPKGNRKPPAAPKHKSGSAQPGEGGRARSENSQSRLARVKFEDLPAGLQAVLLTARVKRKDAEGNEYDDFKVLDCRENVFECLRVHPELAGLVAFNQFAHRAIKTRRPPWKSEEGEWTDQDDLQLGNWLAKQAGLIIRSTRTITDGVAMAAYDNAFHPVMDYLNALPTWDGVERLPYWLSECAGARESDYTRLVGPWFIMNLVRRVRNPGCQADYMFVLEGAQGKRKSTLLRTLVGNDEWFADTPMKIGDKDALLSLAGKWLYEFGELDSFGKAEATTVKQYLTSRIDRVREPFGRRHVDRPRSCCFAGTTNQGEYIKDSTGARRFWPVKCEDEIDLAKLDMWRDQLFAEAMARLDSKDEARRRCWPTREEESEYLDEEQEGRQIGDPWFDKIAEWVESEEMWRVNKLRDITHFTSAEILQDCLKVHMDRIDGARQMAMRVGAIMHKLGWKKVRDGAKAGNQSRVWRYERPEPSSSAQGGTSEPGGPGEAYDDDL